jgi:uncharacterized protein YndB with AHSA1/START domain
MTSAHATHSDEVEASAPGEIEGEGQLVTLVFRRVFHHRPDVVWEAITDPEQLRVWFLTEATIDGRKGGRVEFVTGPTKVHSSGRILEWDPPRVYEHEWNLPASERAPNGESAVVRWELSPAGDGTRVVLTHRKLSRPTAQVFSGGLRAFLDRLSAQLDGRELPDWQRRIGEFRSADARASGRGERPR